MQTCYHGFRDLKRVELRFHLLIFRFICLFRLTAPSRHSAAAPPPRAAPLHTAPVSASAERHEPVAPPCAACSACLNGSTPGLNRAGLLPVSDGDSARGGACDAACCSASLLPSLSRLCYARSVLNNSLIARFSSPETIQARGRVNRRPWRPNPALIECGCGLVALKTCAVVTPKQQADAESAALAKFRA